MESLVSVLLPVYNGEAFVRDAIESVLSQDYANFEVVIVDNASTDGTAEIIADYSCDRRLKVYRNTNTIPRLENFVKVFSLAAEGSSWYKYIGDDDRLLPGCLRDMVRIGEKYQNAGLVTSYYYNGSKLVTGEIPQDQELVEGPALLHNILAHPKARRTIFSPTAIMISPHVYHEMGGFRTDLLHADAELFYRILNSYDLAYIHKPLMAIGYHSGSGQAKSTLSGDTFAEAYIIRYYNLKHYDNIKLSRFEKEKLKNNLVNDSAGYMLARLAEGDLKAAARHLFKVPLSCQYHFLPALLYFTGLVLKKILYRQPIRMLERKNR